MPTKKISVTVDAARLEELLRFTGAGISLSAVLDEALRSELQRYRMAALLAEMEKTNPISDEERAAGNELWRQIESSSIPGRSRSSQKKKGASGKQYRKQ